MTVFIIVFFFFEPFALKLSKICRAYYIINYTLNRFQTHDAVTKDVFDITNKLIEQRNALLIHVTHTRLYF